MKRSIITLVTILFTLTTFAAQKRILVNTPREFIDALGSNREIVICNEDGLLLTPEIQDMIGNGELSEYDRSSRALQMGLHYEHDFDGPMLVICGFKNLTIRTNSDERYKVEVTPRYANVLTFISCENISLNNIYFGHTDEGYCTNGVLAFDDCKNISINNCGLYGCGTEGLELRQSQDFTMIDSEIFHCAYHIMHVVGSKNVKFLNCAFYNNKEYEQVNIYSNSQDVLFDHCVFTKNKGKLFVIENPKAVTLRRCIIQHDGDTGDYYKCSDNSIHINN